MARTVLIALAVPFVLLAGCRSKTTAAITVEAPWVRAASSGSNGAAFMTIHNNAGQADSLVRAQCEAAMMVEIHRTIVRDNVASMAPVDRIEAPSRGRVELAPSGYHVMLMGLKRDLKAGDKLELTLTFQNAGRVAITAEVRNP